MKNRSVLSITLFSTALFMVPLGSQAFQTVQQVAPAQASGAGRGQPTPEQLAIQQASKEDRQQMLDRLHIASLRPPVNARQLGSANYDEAKANHYPELPDPLVMKNGKRVTTAKMWRDQRRPEIVEAFDREIYGRLPKSIPGVKWEVTNTVSESVGDVPIIILRSP
jgi:hypothetical protein